VVLGLREAALHPTGLTGWRDRSDWSSVIIVGEVIICDPRVLALVCWPILHQTRLHETKLEMRAPKLVTHHELKFGPDNPKRIYFSFLAAPPKFT